MLQLESASLHLAELFLCLSDNELPDNSLMLSLVQSNALTVEVEFFSFVHFGKWVSFWSIDLSYRSDSETVLDVSFLDVFC